ncbi:L-carnitine dehydratase/bile acid-inducible protein F [uncultured Desulfobacterium sp.]|uniref:L-carnitine dehydratase/bile acid-inducible protein F n=1 Tax=uncultured Desulfobacterium sp. TaxID=201089 RepID=A0A445MYA7_9BACT|nr:L-carnitine dehydratase/bile acid-inducible protein F [uncultured Desulfobacterium sp.]
MYQPLEGIKILDCTRLLPYQYCTMMLGDLGAEVLKVEEPGEGDYGRWGDGARTYESDAFVMANRNKKSMKLNLKLEKGREILKRLATKYDVLIESFRPGVMDRLGVGYEDMKKVNPAIIYCSTSGFGQTGPYRLKVGHDINYLGYSGILGCTGEQTGRPVIPGIPIGDMAGGGLVTAMAILAALVGRERTGKGQYIDVGQADVLTSLNIRNIAEVLAQRKGRTARPVDLRGFSLCYNSYRTSDGKFIAVGPVEAKFWQNFCKAVGKEEWIKDHLQKYRDGEERTEDLKKLFASKTRDEWDAIFEKIDSCITPVLTPEETMENEHLKQRGMITTMDDPVRGETIQLGFPAKFSDDLNFKRTPAPFFGEHTDEVLLAAGYTKAEIEQLRNEGVIDLPKK